MEREAHPVPRWVIMGAGTGGTSATIGRYIRMQVMATNGRADAHREHKLILDACRKRDVTKAVGLLRQHIEDAGRMLQPAG